MGFLRCRSQAADFYTEHQGKPFFKWVPRWMMPQISVEKISDSKKILFKVILTVNVNKHVAPFHSNLVQFMSSGPVVAMELMGDEAMSIWRGLLGTSDPAVARREAPQSVRAQFGTDGIKNVGHGSDSPAAAARVRMLLCDLQTLFILTCALVAQTWSKCFYSC